MAYKDDGTRWKFTVPQEGEVDSAEKFRSHVREIDAAIMSPDEKAQLTSRGNQQGATVSDKTFVRDEFYSKSEGKDVYVTALHRHPAPSLVPKASESDHAKSADTADSAKVAERLSPGFSINGHRTDGNSDSQGGGDVNISIADIPDAPQVFYGTVTPDRFGGFPAQIRDGSIYVQYSD